MSSGREIPLRRAPGEPVLELHGVSVRLSGRAIVTEVDLTVRAGRLVALVGPNGAGKSTLLAAVSGDVTTCAGAVSLDGRELRAWSHVDAAMRRAVLPQQAGVAFPFTVADVVRMGRAPWARTELEGDDDDAVADAMQLCDVHQFAHRHFPTLSGGERARVSLARVLAQRAQLILLDEPTAALDVHHQELVLEIAGARAADGDSVVVVLHDLGLAAAHADVVVIMSGGRIVAAGPPRDVMTAERLSAVYHHDIQVLDGPAGDLLVVPRRDRRGTAGSAAARPGRG